MVMPSYSIFTSEWDLTKVGPACWGAEYDREVNETKESAIDVELTALCSKYSSADSDVRATIRTQFRGNLNLILFAQRMAVRALRQSDPSWIDMGLVALSIEDNGEYKDVPFAVAFLEHAAWRLSYNLSAATERVVKISSPAAMAVFGKVMFRGVPRSSPLQAIGYREVSTTNAPVIIQKQ